MAQIQTSKKMTRKLSVATGLLSFAAFVIQALSQTWGFPEVGQQIVQTMLAISGGISIYFLGSTTQKNMTENENAAKNAKEK